MSKALEESNDGILEDLLWSNQDNSKIFLFVP